MALVSRAKSRQTRRRLLLEKLENRLPLTAVVSVSPAPNSHESPLSSNVVANFDRDLVGNSATPETFAVHSTLSGQLVGSAATVSTDCATVTLDPTADFFPGELVQVSVTSDVQSLTVDLAVPRVWQGVWLNEGGTFVDSGQNLSSVDVRSSEMSLADIDRDGDLDAVVAITNFTRGGMRVWLNASANTTPPTVTLAVDSTTIDEAAGGTTLTFNLSAAATQDVIIDLGFTGTAALGTDFIPSATQIAIPAGNLSGTITITAAQDLFDEPDETVIVNITSVTNGQEVSTQQVTITIVDDDEPTGFAVTALTHTSTGFQVAFTNEIDAADLSLYDTQTAGLGPADVVLTGAASGPVSGSLVVDASGRMVEFIKTGDALAPDTYTVTLRSATDGFEDIGGLLLDGNGDGTGGDDYSSAFAVAEPAAGTVTVGIPDFVRGPGQGVNLPADETNGIPLTISDGAGVRNVEVHVNYDPSLLQITAATVGAGMPPGSTVALNFGIVPGLAIVTFSSPTDLPGGRAAVVNLQASVPSIDSSGIYGKQQVLDIDSVIITDANANPILAIADDAIHLVSYFGDPSGNGRINAADAAQVARIAALLDGGFAATPLTDPGIVGDISGNGRVNAADASLLAQSAALIEVPQIPPIPGGVVVAGLGDLGPGLPGGVAEPLAAEWVTPVAHAFSTDDRYFTAVDHALANWAEPDQTVEEPLLSLHEAIDELLLAGLP